MNAMRKAHSFCFVLLMGTASSAWPAEEPLDVFRNLVLERFTEHLQNKLSSSEGNTIKLRYIEPDGNGGKSGFGVTYAWSVQSDAATKPPSLVEGTDFAFSGFNYGLDIKGAYAFGDTEMNQNLSEIKASAQLMRANYGRLQYRDEQIGLAFQRCLLLIPAPTTDAAQRRENDRKFDRCIEHNGIDEMLRNDTLAYSYWIDFHGGVEANQNYSERHTLYGLTAAFVSQPSAASEHLNFADWPFRHLRRAFSSDSHSGYVAPFPSVRLALERLDADKDEVRASLTNELTFTRASAEVAFNTIVASTTAGPVRFNISYRHFSELSAPREIRTANLDSQDFMTAALYFPARLLPLPESDRYELFVRYTHGKLPFDTASDHAYEVGIATNFEWLGELLQR